MRFSTEFELSKTTLPIDWRRIILSFFKRSLSEANGGKYFDEYYALGKEKPFCFSVSFNEPVFFRDTVEVTGKSMRLIVSTADSRTGFILFSSMMAQKKKAFPLPLGNSMRMTDIKQLKEESVHSDRILVKMLEPLCIRSHNRETNKDWYYSVKHKDFDIESKRVVKEQLIAAGFSEELSSVNIIPVNTKIVIVKYYGINIECSLGDFVLEGDKAVLNYLIKSGLGSRKSAGFGVAQVLAEE